MSRMKTGRNNRKYDDAFKREVLEQVKEGRSVQEVSEGLGVSAALIYRWKAQQSGPPQEEGDEFKELRKRLKSLEVDNAILKKALSILSRDG